MPTDPPTASATHRAGSGGKLMPLLVLAALAIMASALVLRFTLTGGERGDGDAAVRAPGQAGDGVAGSSSEAQAADSGAMSAAEADARAAFGQSGNAPLAGAQSKANLRGFIGKVDSPPGAPSDAELRVLAFNSPRTKLDLVGYEDGGTLAGPLDGEAERLGAFAEARVDPSGRFELELPDVANEVHLAAMGRWVVSPGTTAFARDVAVEDVRLVVELGGLIRGQLVADPRLDAVDFSEWYAEVGLDPSAGFNTFVAANFSVRRRALVNASGEFELRAIGTDEQLRLNCSGTGAAPARRDGFALTPGATESFELNLLRGVSLSGRVLDSKGVSIPGATVRVEGRQLIDRRLQSGPTTVTDAQGRFEFKHAPDTPIQVAAEAPSFRPASLALDELEDGERRSGLELRLDRGASIRGRVRFEDGAPAVGAQVTVDVDPSRQLGFSALSGKRGGGGVVDVETDGTYEVSGLGDTEFRVVAELERDGKLTHRAALEGVAPNADPVDLALAATAELAGTVLAPDGRAARNFTVRASLEGTGQRFGIGQRSLSDEVQESVDGAFQIDGMEPGSWTVTVHAPGFAMPEALTVRVPDDARDDLQFLLEPPALASGVVIGPSGAAVAGARVEIRSDLRERMRNDGSNETALTDSEGRFEFRALNPGRVTFVATHNEFAPSVDADRELASGEQARDLVLELRRGSILTGEVFGPDEEPQANRMITAQLSPNYVEQVFAMTDESGAFVMENMAAGTWQIVAVQNLLNRDSSEEEDIEIGDLLKDMLIEMVDLVDGENAHVVLGQRRADPVAVRARVVHGDVPVSDAIVSFVPAETKAFSAFAVQTTGDDGLLEIELDGPGVYEVTVQKSGEPGEQTNVEFRRRVEASDGLVELEFALELGRISGRVETADGDPAVNCRMSLTRDEPRSFGSLVGDVYVELYTDASGEYQFEYLEPGSYRVYAGGSPQMELFGDDAAHGRIARSGIRLGPGEQLEGIDLEVPKPSRLEGKVIDAETGAPVPDATIFIRAADGYTIDRISSLMTDSAGKFSARALGPGAYTVAARAGAKASAESAPIEIAPQEPGSVELALEPGTMLRVSLSDEGGDVMADDYRARLSVVNEEGREFADLQSMQSLMIRLRSGFSVDEQVLGPLPPGNYSIEVTTNDGRSKRKSVKLSGQDERSVRIRLR